jgi:hypothetical protein
MTLLNYKNVVEFAISELDLQIGSLTTTSPQGEPIVRMSNLDSIRHAILELENTGVPGIYPELEGLRDSGIFKSAKDVMNVTSVNADNILKLVAALQSKLEMLRQLVYMEQTEVNAQDPFIVQVLIPKISSFTELEKISDDLEKVIEKPVIHENIGGKAEIISASHGSIVFFVALGTSAAVAIVIRILWAAAVVRKKYAEAKYVEEQVRTLKIKNDAFQAVADGLITQQKELLNREAVAIATHHYPGYDNDLLERTKLSITTMATLMDKGVKILPASDSPAPEGLEFPDYKQLSVATSLIKELGEGNVQEDVSTQ